MKTLLILISLLSVIILSSTVAEARPSKSAHSHHGSMHHKHANGDWHGYAPHRHHGSMHHKHPGICHHKMKKAIAPVVKQPRPKSCDLNRWRNNQDLQRCRARRASHNPEYYDFSGYKIK
jgi:hypothetical protein